jgi:hypothetical protein
MLSCWAASPFCCTKAGTDEFAEAAAGAAVIVVAEVELDEVVTDAAVIVGITLAELEEVEPPYPSWRA